MSTKKVILKINREKLSEYLGLEIIDPEVEIQVSIPDDKKNLSALVSSPVISDWDFQEDKPETDKLDIIKPKQSEVQEYSVKKEKFGILEKLGVEKNYNKIAWTLEAIWKLSQKSPSLLFGSSLFLRAIEEELKNTDINSEHTIIAMLTEIRYRSWDLSNIDEDLTEKLKKEWQGMKELSLTDLAKRIYER